MRFRRRGRAGGRRSFRRSRFRGYGRRRSRRRRGRGMRRTMAIGYRW